MGARVYIPTIGRFLQVDPVEGGTDNNYVYAVDPVNEYDLNGMFIGFLLKVIAPKLSGPAAKQTTKQAVKQTPKQVIKHAPKSMPKAAPSSPTPTLQVRAASPVGSRSSQLIVRPKTNTHTSIGGRQYSGHAVDQMQGRGIYPSVVENTIRVGRHYSQINKNHRYYDEANDIGVILNDSGRVVTTFYGRGH